MRRVFAEHESTAMGISELQLDRKSKSSDGDFEKKSRTAFLFDLDGTLVDSVYQHVLAWREALEHLGIDLSVWRIHRRIGMSGGLLVNGLLREIGRALRRRRRHVSGNFTKRPISVSPARFVHFREHRNSWRTYPMQMCLGQLRRVAEGRAPVRCSSCYSLLQALLSLHATRYNMQSPTRIYFWPLPTAWEFPFTIQLL
jgi:hypothetical protein